MMVINVVTLEAAIFMHGVFLTQEPPMQQRAGTTGSYSINQPTRHVANISPVSYSVYK